MLPYFFIPVDFWNDHDRRTKDVRMCYKTELF